MALLILLPYRNREHIYKIGNLFGDILIPCVILVFYTVIYLFHWGYSYTFWNIYMNIAGGAPLPAVFEYDILLILKGARKKVSFKSPCCDIGISPVRLRSQRHQWWSRVNVLVQLQT